MRMHLVIGGMNSFRYRRFWIVQLALAIFLGLLTGVLIPVSSNSQLVSLMLLTADSQLSIVSVFVVSVLPFLITAFAVYFSCPLLLHPLAFIKMLCFGYSSILILSSLGSSGWLIRIALLFSDFISIPLLCWLWIRCNYDDRTNFLVELLGCLAISLAAGCINQYLIAPYLAFLL